MAKPRKDLSAYAGFRQQRRVEGRGGIIVLWDCSLDCPSKVKSGPKGERWVVEYRPPGRGKFERMPLRTIRDAKAVLRGLAANEDKWGFWSDNAAGSSSQNGTAEQNGARNELSQEGGGEVTTVPPRRLDLSVLLKGEIPDSEIVAGLRELTTATKPIYANEGGNVKVVANEPDYPTREKGWKLLLAYRDGKPIERKEEVKRYETSDMDVAQKIRDRPSYRRTIMAYCEEHEAKDRRNPIDVDGEEDSEE